MHHEPLHPRQRDARFDFIIVGSGAGGAPLACNLARKGFRVLVLEAGGWDEPEVAKVPAFHPHASEHPDLSWEFFVKHYQQPPEPDSKPHGPNGGLFYPRAATVGGCTMHNAMITICGPAGDWDEIAGITDDDSWSGERMRPYFERIEHCDYGRAPAALRRVLNGVRGAVEDVLDLPHDNNPARHGYDGWLHTTWANPASVVDDAGLLFEVLSALHGAQARGLNSIGSLVRNLLKGTFVECFDPNNWQTLRREPEGLALIPIAVNGGSRSSPRNLLRSVMKEHPESLVVQTETLAAEILFDDQSSDSGSPPTAIGVRVRRGKHLYRAHPQSSGQEGVQEDIYCRREVILCGGAYNTPQLLKLSGIGPAAELNRWKIKVRVDLPGVGTNLQDRYEVGIVSQMSKDFSILKGLSLGPPQPGRPPDAALDQWLSQGTGLYASNAAVLGIFKKSRADLPAPDLFIFALPGYFKGYYKGYSKDIATRHDQLTWALLKAHTKNRAGTVTLRSTNPLDVPEINFHYFTEGSDVEGADLSAMVEGVKFIREINRIATDKGAVKQEVWPGDGVATEEDIAKFVTREAWGHHASCSCPIGADGDPMAALDSRFHVRGTRGLRVVDASVFPRIPGVFLVTNIYMVSEKAGDVIAEDNQ